MAVTRDNGKFKTDASDKEIASLHGYQIPHYVLFSGSLGLMLGLWLGFCITVFVSHSVRVVLATTIILHDIVYHNARNHYENTICPQTLHIGVYDKTTRAQPLHTTIPLYPQPIYDSTICPQPIHTTKPTRAQPLHTKIPYVRHQYIRQYHMSATNTYDKTTRAQPLHTTIP